MQAVKLVHTKEMDREEWLKNRKRGIGGSDAAAVAGVSKYSSPLVVYMEKRGLYNKVVDNEAANWGNIMEPIIRKEFVKRINAERDEKQQPHLKVSQCNYLLQHPKHEFMLANIDGLIKCPVLGNGILEIKTASEYLKEDWAGEDIPNAYYIQVQHYLAVTGLKYAMVAVLIGGNKFKHYYIPRDEETIESLIAIEFDFWNNHILAKVPPVASQSDAETEMMKIMYPGSYDEPVIELPIEFRRIVEKHEEYKEQEKRIKEWIKDCRNKIAFGLKEQAQAFAGPHQITFKANKNGVKSLKIKLNKREVEAV
jgi:putative phage-type endonuclease